MRADRDVRGAAVQEEAQRRKRRANPRVVRDSTVLERDVQVRPHENALARDGRLANRARALHD
jgi:hypothetical protein